MIYNCSKHETAKKKGCGAIRDLPSPQSCRCTPRRVKSLGGSLEKRESEGDKRGTCCEWPWFRCSVSLGSFGGHDRPASSPMTLERIKEGEGESRVCPHVGCCSGCLHISRSRAPGFSKCLEEGEGSERGEQDSRPHVGSMGWASDPEGKGGLGRWLSHQSVG